MARDVYMQSDSEQTESSDNLARRVCADCGLQWFGLTSAACPNPRCPEPIVGAVELVSRADRVAELETELSDYRSALAALVRRVRRVGGHAEYEEQQELWRAERLLGGPAAPAERSTR